jgi:predicted nucleic acid-binding protein
LPKNKLVFDTTVCIDLFNGCLLEKTARLPYELALPDVIAAELIHPPGDLFIQSGFSKLQLNENAIEQIIALRERFPRPSTNDLFALLLAKINSCALITGDDALRKAAKKEGVSAHGLLWILDRLIEYKILIPIEAADALEKILAEGSWLPKNESEGRLKCWKRSS